MTDLANQPVESVGMTWRKLQTICNTELVPKAYRGRPDAALGAIEYGREMGLGPMQSLNRIDVVDGKPSLSAELMNALVRARGHSIVIDKLDNAGCTLTGTRADNGDTMTVTFDAGHAERAGLTKRGNWKSYAEDMFFARAVSRLGRYLFPDVFTFHAYTPQDLGEIPEPTPLEQHEQAVEEALDAVEVQHDEQMELDPERPFVPVDANGNPL